MSNLSDLLPAGASAKSITATDSGSGIAINTPVILETAGTVTQVVETSDAVGTPVVYQANGTTWNQATFDSSNNKVVVSYNVGGTGALAVVGTVSGTAISYGTPVAISGAGNSYGSITYDSSNNKVVIAYRDYSSSDYGTAVVGTVSGTSISFGTPVVFKSANSDWISATFDSDSNKVVIAYRISGQGTAIVATVSGTSISYGTEVAFESNGSQQISATFDSDSNKVVIAYRDGLTDYGEAVVGTVSGTSISFGTIVVFNAATTAQLSTTFDSDSNKVVISYEDMGNSNYGTAIVGTVSGTSISFGSEAVFESAETENTTASFDSAANKVVIAYQDDANYDYGTLVVGTVSGTAISFGSPIIFRNDQVVYTGSVYDSNENKVVIVYSDGGNSDYGTGVVFSVGGSNMTASNFLGIADEAISASASGVIVVQGGTKNAANTILPQTMSFGSEAVFESAASTHISASFDSDSNRVVVAYSDEGNSDLGTAVVGTVSGTSISWGTPVVFDGSPHGAKYMSTTFDSDSNVVVIAYSDIGNSSHGTAIVGTVSGTSISFGTAVVFEAAEVYDISASFDSTANKVVIAYRDAGNSQYGTGIVGTVSGTAISFGTAVVFESAESKWMSATYDANADRTVIAYMDDANSDYGTAVVGTVSGTAISFGTAVVFNAFEAIYIASTYDSTAQKVVISYMDGGSAPSNQGTAIVGTVSGTTISFGTEVIFNAASSNYMGMTYDANANRVVIGYQETSKGYVVLGTVSGTTVSFGTPVVFNNIDTGYISPVYNSTDNKVVVSFKDTGNSNYGTGIVGTIGDGTFTIGSNYYVQADGSYDTSAGTPSVKAGLAISTTSLLLSGDS